MNGWTTSPEGHKLHVVNGVIHNDEGPGVIYAYGTKVWYQYGKRHRLDGPAVEHLDGDKYWWFENKHVDVISQKEFERWLKLRVFL